MNTLRQRSLVRLLSSVLTAALSLEILMAGLVTVTLIAAIASPDDSLISAWPLEMAEGVRYPAAATSTGPEEVSVRMNRGTVQFSSQHPGYYLLKWLETMATFALAISITVLLRQVLRSLRHAHPFTPDNARRLRFIAYLVLAITPYSLLRSAVYSLFIYRHVAIEGKVYAYPFRRLAGRLLPDQVWLDLDVNLLTLLIGMILLIVAEVFRQGVAIQLDNESIV